MSDDKLAQIEHLIDLLFDLITLAENAVGKRYFAVVKGLFGIMGDLSPVVAGWAEIKGELPALMDQANQVDLIAYLQQKFAGLGTDRQAQNVATKVLEVLQHLGLLVEDALELKALVKK